MDCVFFDHALEQLSADRLDILQIDTEGHDAYILSLFPFDLVRPAIVHWEVKHLTKRQRKECMDRLASAEYSFAPSGIEDIMSV